MGGKVARIGVDGLPPFYQRKLLKSQIAVDAAKTCAARSQIRIELQTRTVNRPVVVQFDGFLYVL